MKTARPIKLSVTGFRALKALCRAGRRGLCAADVGGEVWPDRVLRAGRGVATGGGGDYAAQMLLGKLRAAKQVAHVHSEGSTIWCITADGLVSLAAAERAAKEVRR